MSPFWQCCAQLFHTWPVLVVGFVSIQLQDLAFGFVESHEVHLDPLLKPVYVPLAGILSLWHVNHSLQLGIICKLAEGALNPTVDVTEEDVKEYEFQK